MLVSFIQATRRRSALFCVVSYPGKLPGLEAASGLQEGNNILCPTYTSDNVQSNKCHEISYTQCSLDGNLFRISQAKKKNLFSSFSNIEAVRNEVFLNMNKDNRSLLPCFQNV